MNQQELSTQRCEPCEGGILPFTTEEAGTYLADLGDDLWHLSEDGKSIEKKFTFYDSAAGDNDWNAKWQRGVIFTQKIAQIAGEQNHHPTIVSMRSMRKGGLVEVKFSTHVIGGLSKNDFIMAAKLNGIYAGMGG